MGILVNLEDQNIDKNAKSKGRIQKVSVGNKETIVCVIHYNKES